MRSKKSKITAILIITALLIIGLGGYKIAKPENNEKDVFIITKTDLSTFDLKAKSFGVALNVTSDNLKGTFSSVPSEFACLFNSEIKKSNKNYTIIIGAKPALISNSGVLLCSKAETPETVYLCKIQNKKFNAFSNNPPFNFQEVEWLKE